jgi:hypothetical protein
MRSAMVLLTMAACGKYLFFTSERPGIAPTPASGARPPGDLYQIEVAALGI